MKSDPSNSRHALEIRAITEIENKGNYKAKAVTNKIIGTDEEYTALLCGSKSKIWTQAFTNDLGRLSPGVYKIIPTGKNTILFINKNHVPKKKR